MGNLLYLLLLISCSFLFPKVSIGQIPLDYDEIGIKFIPKKAIDTIELSTIKFNKTLKCKVYLKSLFGACDFKIYNSKGELFLEGHYSNCLDTLSKYRFAKRKGLIQKTTTLYGVILYKYFYPLKSGDWNYYDKRGGISERYHYEYEIVE